MPTIKPQDAFANQMAKAARASTHAGKTITTTEADKALGALAPLSPTAKVEAVEAFLASAGAKKLSPAARGTLRDFVARNDRSHPPALPVRPPPYMKFHGSIEHAATHGKVKGQITKGEILTAFKHIADLPMVQQKALAQELLAGPRADNLSKAARAYVEAKADVQISFGSTEAVGEEGGGHMVTLAIPEGGATTMAVGEEGGGSTEAVGEEGGGTVTSLALGEEGGSITEAIGEDGGSVGGGHATTMAVGEEGGGFAVTLAIPEGGFTTEAIGEE